MANKYKLHRLNFFNHQTNPINCLDYNNVIKKLAVSRENSSIEIWDFNQVPFLEKVLTLQPGTSVEDISWCGSRLFSTGLSALVVEHDLISLKEKLQEKVSLIGGPAWCLSANTNNTLLAAGTEEGYVCLLQVYEGSFSYHRKFDKQDGRVLCLSWHSSGQSLATGSVDAIRIWNVETGHAMTRIAVGRLKKNIETVLWSILYLKDHTIVSGDSYGRTSFWDGHVGTLKSSCRVHKADVLALCVDKDEKFIYSSGIDPLIVQFSKVNTKHHDDKGNREIYVKSLQIAPHTHDVRALSLIDKYVVSGGVDCHLTLTSGPPKVVHKYAPVNCQKCFRIAVDSRCVLLQYPRMLEVWRLGETSETKDSDGECLNLSLRESKVLQLECRADEQIVSSAISSDARLIAYSSTERIRIFNLELVEDPITLVPSAVLNKVKMVPSVSITAHAMCFTSSGKHLLLATDQGNLDIWETNLIQSYHIHTFSKPMAGKINLLESSPDENICSVSDHEGNVTILDIDKQKVWSTLPSYKYQTTAMAFSPHSKNLFVVYLDGKVIEYDFTNKCYTKQCNELKNLVTTFDRQYAILKISFDLNNAKKIFFHSENNVYSYVSSIPKVATSPRKAKKSKMSDAKDSQDHLVTTCKKFQHLLAFASLSQDELVALELTPEQIQLQLPAVLKKKKFGT